MKKVIALLTVFAMVFAFAACNNDKKPEETQTTTVEQQENLSENSGEISNEANGENVNPSENQSEVATELVSLPDDPSQWTDEQIIEFYKAAAAKSHPTAKHSQTMSLGSLVLGDGGGAIGFLFDKVAMPAINSALKKNSTDFDGITGGYKDLVVTDAKSVKAYKQGNYTIVEMTMKDQIDGKHGHNMSGTVGHAITVLGDVSVAVAEFPQFKIDTDNADIKIHYNNATVKVRINQNGIIEKGTWEYVSSVDVQNLALNFKDGKLNDLVIKKAKADVNYKIVLGGGF